jgi:hypothetical protein
MGSGDFSVELWYYPTNAARQVIAAQSNGAGNAIAFWIEKDASNQLRIVVEVGGTQYVATATATMPLNAWAFIQVVRSGTTVYGYQNGTQVCSVSVGSGSLRDSTDVVSVGGGTVSLPVYGYVSNLRILKGTASSATTPTSPLTAISGTSLLLNFTNAGIIDNTAKNVLETVGNAQISTSVKKFGTGSLAFDGTGDYLAKPVDPQNLLGTGDFTVECWVYPAALNSYNMIFGYASPNQYWSIRNTGYLHFYDGTSVFEATTGAVSTNQWTHIAISRSGSTLKQFVNGAEVLSSTCATSIGAASGTNIWFGASAFYTTQHFFNGYIDDLRITKGIARYASNFTPPTAAFPDL